MEMPLLKVVIQIFQKGNYFILKENKMLILHGKSPSIIFLLQNIH